MKVVFYDAVWVITEGNIFTQSGHHVLHSVSLPPSSCIHRPLFQLFFPNVTRPHEKKHIQAEIEEVNCFPETLSDNISQLGHMSACSVDITPPQALFLFFFFAPS